MPPVQDSRSRPFIPGRAARASSSSVVVPSALTRCFACRDASSACSWSARPRSGQRPDVDLQLRAAQARRHLDARAVACRTDLPQRRRDLRLGNPKNRSSRDARRAPSPAARTPARTTTPPATSPAAPAAARAAPPREARRPRTTRPGAVPTGSARRARRHHRLLAVGLLQRGPRESGALRPTREDPGDVLSHASSSTRSRRRRRRPPRR